MNIAVYVVERWTEGHWTPVDPDDQYGARLMVYPLRYVAERMRRRLRKQGHKSRVTPAVLS